MEVMRSILRPCEEVCKLLGGEKYVTASVVLPACAYLRKQMTVIEDDIGYERRFKEAFFAHLISRLNNIDSNANCKWLLHWIHDSSISRPYPRLNMREYGV